MASAKAEPCSDARGAANAPVDVIVRAHDRAAEGLLARALSSVWYQQTASDITVLLVTSNFDTPIDWAWVRARAMQPLQRWPGAGERRLEHHDIRHDGDSRVALLALGLRLSHSPRLMCLDYDDVLRGQAVDRLAAALTAPDVEVAVGPTDLVMQRSDGRDEQRIVLPYSTTRPTRLGLLSHNSAPLHSLMFRNGPWATDPRFPSALGMYEDYWILLQALSRGSLGVAEGSEAVAEYWIGTSHESQWHKYADVRRDSENCIQELRRSLRLSIGMQELMDNRQAESARIRADRAMLAALPCESNAPDAIIDAVIALDHGSYVVGWACDRRDGGRPVDAAFAIDAAGTPWLITTWFERPDVSRALGIGPGPWGYCALVPTGVERVVLIVRGLRHDLTPCMQS